jgi:predicted DNA-binding transcriptional regulator AlpA
MITADKARGAFKKSAVTGSSDGVLSTPKRNPTDTAEQAQQRLAARLLSKRELAAVLNVCGRTIDNWLAQKRIPRLRLSNRLTRFSLPKVEAALARYEIKEVGARR